VTRKRYEIGKKKRSRGSTGKTTPSTVLMIAMCWRPGLGSGDRRRKALLERGRKEEENWLYTTTFGVHRKEARYFWGIPPTVLNRSRKGGKKGEAINHVSAGTKTIGSAREG